VLDARAGHERKVKRP